MLRACFRVILQSVGQQIKKPGVTGDGAPRTVSALRRDNFCFGLDSASSSSSHTCCCCCCCNRSPGSNSYSAVRSVDDAISFPPVRVQVNTVRAVTRTITLPSGGCSSCVATQKSTAYSIRRYSAAFRITSERHQPRSSIAVVRLVSGRAFIRGLALPSSETYCRTFQSEKPVADRQVGAVVTRDCFACDIHCTKKSSRLTQAIGKISQLMALRAPLQRRHRP